MTSQRVTGGNDIVWGVAADPAGRRLASAHHNGLVLLRDAHTLAIERVLQKEGDVAWAAAFSPDGRLVAAATGNDVVIWECATGREVHRLRHGDAARAVAFHPREPWVVTAARDLTVRLWDVGTGQEVRRLLEGVNVQELTFGPHQLAAACRDGAIRVWEDLAHPPVRVAVGKDPVWAVAFAPDGTCATGSQGGVVRLWDPRGWQVLAVLDGVRPLRDLSFDDSGRYLTASAYVSLGAVWDFGWLRPQLARLGLDWE